MNYSDVTEVPDVLISGEALQMMKARYGYAAEMAVGKDVLELACGAGLGLGAIAQRARKVVGADCTAALLAIARRHIDVPLVRLDAHQLPFRSAAFGVVLIYEAIYYFADAARVLSECRRVLEPGGTLIVCTVNREWSDFNPSPHSTKYYSRQELEALLNEHFGLVTMYGAFAASRETARDVVVSAVKRTAIALRLMPRTMRGKQMLKRLFMPSVVPVPAQIHPARADRAVLEPLDGGRRPVGEYKVLYAVAGAAR